MAHSRIELWAPSTCHAQDPVGLPWPPSAWSASYPPPRVELALVEVGLAPGARDAQDRQRPERVELGEDKCRLEVAPGIVHGLVNCTSFEHAPQRIDEPMMNDNLAVRIDLADLLELPARHLVRLHAGAACGGADAHSATSHSTAA
jgi:hypothetical protein